MRKPRQPGSHLEKVGHRVTQDEERPFWCILFRRLPHEPGSRAIVGEDGFKIPLENERSVSLHEEDAARLHDANENLAHKRSVFAEVLADDGRSARRTGVIAGVGKAGKALQQNFQLEEVLDLSIQRQSPEPLLARMCVLASEAPRIEQQIVVGITLLVRAVCPIGRHRRMLSRGSKERPFQAKDVGHAKKNHFAGQDLAILPRRFTEPARRRRKTEDALRQEERGDKTMNIAKALAMSAVTGMLMGSMVACGGGNASEPGAAAPAAGGKSSCSAGGGAAAPAASGKSSCSAAGGATAPAPAPAPAPKY
jgi:hypothetical protein